MKGEHDQMQNIVQTRRRKTIRADEGALYGSQKE